MILNEKPQILFDEDNVSGEATIETPETEESIEENTEESTTNEEVDLEEYSEDEIDQALEELSTDEEIKPKFYDGRFESVDELEKAYAESSKEAMKLKRERDELKRQIEESSTQQKVVEPEEENLKENLWFDPEEYENIYWDEGIGKAELYKEKCRNQYLQETQYKSNAENMTKEAEDFNRQLTLGRARELLLEKAKTSGNELLIEKYSNNEYLPAIEEIESHDEVYNQWIKEADYVAKKFLKPLIIGDRVVSQKGKLDKDAYEIAKRALNYEQAIKTATINAAEDTAKAVSQEGVPNAKIGTPTGGNKATPKVIISKDDDEYEAREKAKKLSTEELKAEAEKRGIYTP